MIDLTPLDVRKKKGDFRRTVRGYDPELVDDFLDMVAERLEELVKQNVALTERGEHLQDQVASYRNREKALNEALVTAQQLRSEAQAQADKEADLLRREAQGKVDRILEDGQRAYRDLLREIEGLHTRKMQFLRSFRGVLEGFLGELEVEEARAGERVDFAAAALETSANSRPPAPQAESATEPEDEGAEDAGAKQEDWLTSLVQEGDVAEEET